MHTINQPNTFIWASGIENTFVPQTRSGHYEHWRDDLRLARELGVQALRWGVPWYRVELEQGQFDWRWTDQVISYMVQESWASRRSSMHYGCPLWMEQPFVNLNDLRAVAAYAGPFEERYRDLIRWYTLLKELLMNDSI